MYKLYRKQGSILRSLVIRVKLGEREIPVQFSGGTVSINVNCEFGTDDTALQKALENHKDFKAPDGFVTVDGNREPAENPNTQSAGTAGGAKNIDLVKTLDDAKKYILKNYKSENYSQLDLADVNSVNAIAEKHGVAFPNLAG